MCAFFISRELRLITDLIPWIALPIKTLSTSSLITYAFFWSILYIVLFSLHWLYSSQITQSKVKEFIDIIQYSIYWFLFFSVGIFFLQWIVIESWNEIPRLIILFTCILSAIWIIIERILLNTAQYYFLQKGFFAKKQLLLINNKTQKTLEYIIADIKKAGVYEIQWYINTKEKKNIWKSLTYLWWLAEYKKIVAAKKIDEVLYIESGFWEDELYEIWDLSRIYWIRYRSIAQLFDQKKSQNTSLSLMYKLPLLEVENTPLWMWWRVSKRFIDIIISIFWLLLLFPLWIVISIIIKLHEPHAPVIYKNRRIWQKWKEFNLFKFRYLKWEHCIKESYWIPNAEDSAIDYEKTLINQSSSRKWPLYKIQNDPRKTPIGNFIEKYSIDEVPQLINVLLWDMSIVGPRPHQPREVKQYELWEKRVLTIKPWITWMAQVHWREKNWFEEEAKMDIFYIENWNLLLDLKLLLKTFSIILKR